MSTEAATFDIAPATPASQLGVVDQLLRDRAGIADRIEHRRDLPGLARTTIAIIAVSMALVGAALGSYRGGVQTAYAAIKLPLVMLLTAALCAPTLTALNAALGRPASITRDLARILAALAFGSLVLLAQTPLLLLTRAMSLGYHDAILLTVGCFTVGGLATVLVLTGFVRRAGSAGVKTVVAGLMIAFAMVGAQMAWTLRPYLVRPRTSEVPFLRSIEGSLLEAIEQTVDSAQGYYHRDFAPLPGDSLEQAP